MDKKTKGEEVMLKLDFGLEHPELFEKIIKIVRKHDGNYTATQDDFKTTQLIMKEIGEWQEGVSRLTPICASLILDGVKSKKGYTDWDWVKKEKCISNFSNLIRDIVEGE